MIVALVKIIDTDLVDSATHEATIKEHVIPMEQVHTNVSPHCDTYQCTVEYYKLKPLNEEKAKNESPASALDIITGIRNKISEAKEDIKKRYNA